MVLFAQSTLPTASASFHGKDPEASPDHPKGESQRQKLLKGRCKCQVLHQRQRELP